jgi:hypothetical protein
MAIGNCWSAAEPPTLSFSYLYGQGCTSAFGRYRCAGTPREAFALMKCVRAWLYAGLEGISDCLHGSLNN